MTAIEEVQPGNDVWSYNHATQQWELREVERVFEHIYFGDVVAVTIRHDDDTHESIEATGNHPFWVVAGETLGHRPRVTELPSQESHLTSGGRWVEARHLRLGDHFLTRTGKSATVVGLIIRIERVKVYNLQVAELHLYAVGEHGVLVHNSAIGRNMKDRVIPYANRRGFRYMPRDDGSGRSLMRQNREWLKKQMREGRWIYDIGPGKKPLPPSKFYDWERRFLERTRYRRYVWDPQP